MIGSLRGLAERPIADPERPRLFAIAAAILVVSAILLIALRSSTGEESQRTAPQAPSATAPREQPNAPSTEPSVPPAAERAARRFLAGYLGFVYGRRGVQEIESITPALRLRLASSRVRVPPAARRRSPRVVDVQAQRLRDGAIAITAEVADGGVARYPVRLTLRRRGGWNVVEVGTD